MTTRKSETSKMVSATPSKRRSKKITNQSKSSQKRRQTKTRQAPQHKNVSSSSSSSSEYDESKTKVNDDMEVDSFSDEIGENFSEEGEEICDRPISNSSCSDKENRRITRSQASRPMKDETPSKKLAQDISRMSVSASSKNLFERSPKTSTKRKENTTRKTSQKSTVNVFDESNDETDRTICEAQNDKKRTPLTLRFPANMIKPKITPVIIHKTPGGTLRTRRRVRQNSEELTDIVDPLDSSSARTLKELASRLHLSKVPEKLPCRGKEAGEIEKFIREVIDPKKGESSAMYISGVPGTGKTATVRAVVNSMKKHKKYPKFVYVEVNAMIFKKTVFIEVYNGIQEEYNISKKIQKTKIAASAARQELNTIFKKEDPNRPPIIVLIDELDSLCNRKQDVLYDIFEWTALPQSKVTIIGIANTLDFPERMLCQRNASRLDKRRLVFQPYQHEQIEEIVRARLQGSNLIDQKAVELVAKKVAMNTGDLRQALDFLCRAIGVAVEKKSEKLEISHVMTAQSAVLEPLKYRLVKGLRLHQFTLFRAIVNMTSEQEEVIFSNIYKSYCIICSEVSGIEPASDNFAYGMLLQLASSALVVLVKGDHGTMNRRVKLGMTSIEAERAMKEAVEKHKTNYSL